MLRKRPEETILILDDVLGRIEEPHIGHAIMTMHYKPWREKYRWGFVKRGQPCQFIELTGWAIQESMRLSSTRPETERLEKLLAQSPVDARSVCAKAGVNLEALTCPTHGWLGNNGSGSYWRNSGDTRRLHPLQKPN